jgi:hypothetical protein
MGVTCFRRPPLFWLFHWCFSQQCSCICCREPHTYGHTSPPSIPYVQRFPPVRGASNAAIGSDVSIGNRNSHCFNASSSCLNPPISATWFVILWRSCFVYPWGRLGVKWESIWLGNTAYLHFLQIITWNSGKWMNWSIFNWVFKYN